MKINFSNLFQKDLDGFSIFILVGPSQFSQIRSLRYIEDKLRLNVRRVDLKTEKLYSEVRRQELFPTPGELLLVPYSTGIDFAKLNNFGHKVVITCDKWSPTASWFKQAIQSEKILLIPTFEENVSELELSHLLKKHEIVTENRKFLSTFLNSPQQLYNTIELMSFLDNADSEPLLSDILSSEDQMDIMQRVKYQLRKKLSSSSFTLESLRELWILERLVKTSPAMASSYSLFYVEH